MIFERIYCFNPRPCARGDPKVVLKEPEVSLFQSTPLREGRRDIPAPVFK